ncbi:hypothetical protein GGTG_13656 [Gaeumannomyces tritici R3-111a-1]|uniref:PAS domain-containing protein n=1 Tax=Gaeumannomyces tritici (strain R3-111a-1) TaxID=644352 RepID=J3PJH4_GAET3|nr:hypothetical protein GGTG_13656 [Gaeumannomyces tritici R3-111a-1]EJT68779.1 hypothetical protein GGTG_13656 [Gaeumannomyces tritici R3-111a-1]
MEQTFMTIQNLTPDANVLFVSESIVDILGYQPQEVFGRSCFDFFHPDEIPFARSVHSRGILLDKAAVLHYARLRGRDGQWVSCECCFTVVHDVLVACTSIYRRGVKSERRALEAPQIRRIFSCSPRDPRYHMLEHLSPKFRMPAMEREPRAALILNRFTRSLNIMYATNAVSTILGIAPDDIKNTSFYDCIQENCLPDAVRCLESAKANDSIAYLRFWFRDPRVGDDMMDDDQDEEDDEDDDSDSENGGVQLSSEMDIDSDGRSPAGGSREVAQPPAPAGRAPAGGQGGRRRQLGDGIELEAVVSCTSDGLVVVLRKARPPIPTPHPPQVPHVSHNLAQDSGMFAAPWGREVIRPQPHADLPPELLYIFRPPLMPQYMPLRDSVKEASGPSIDQFMGSIRDVAVFAWALVGINGNFASYGRGVPSGESQPPDGFPVWDPKAGDMPYLGPENQAALKWARLGKVPEDGRPHPDMAAAAAAAAFGSSSSSQGGVSSSGAYSTGGSMGHATEVGHPQHGYGQPTGTWQQHQQYPPPQQTDYQQQRQYTPPHVEPQHGYGSWQPEADGLPRDAPWRQADSAHNPASGVPTTQAGSGSGHPSQRFEWQ